VPPECPIWLSPFAQEEWHRTAPELERLGLLTQVDGAAFEAYCQSYANWKEATLLLRQEGLTFETPNGYVQQRPEVAIANNAAKLMRGYIHEFGLSPSARANMNVEQGRDVDDGSDFFSKAQ
jgi:P27 family predicted phage terminase small subunit